MNENRLEKIRKRQELLEQLENVNAELASISQNPSVKEYLRLLGEQRQIREKCEKLLKSSCAHRMVIFLGYGKSEDGVGPLELPYPVQEYATYVCVDCGETITLSDQNFMAIACFEAHHEVLGHRYDISLEGANRMLGYYRDLIGTVGKEEARRLLKANYHTMIKGSSLKKI